MLFSFLNVDKRTELKLRKRRAETLRINKRTQRLLAAERVRRFEDTLTVEKIVAGMLSDCVDAVCRLETKRKVLPTAEVKVQQIEIPKETPVKRRRHN